MNLNKTADPVSLSQFAQDVDEGLSSHPKRLSSKYFYDSNGDKLFQQIMNLEEYYLTRAELNIFETQKERMLEIFDSGGAFRIVELGAGDGMKTKVLLKYFQEEGAEFSYNPVDISANVLEDLQESMRSELPDLVINPLAGDYFTVLSDLKFRSHKRNIVFFLGSNIGNFRHDLAVAFLSSIQQNLEPGDNLLIGFDLKKDPKRILRAYDDSKGVTRAFNLNLLHRINAELGGNFNVDEFDHNPIYDPMTGECRSYLVARTPQEVYIADLEKTFKFEAWEPIYMEVSKKYDLQEIAGLASETGFQVETNLTDSEGLFVDSIWKVV